MLVCFIPVLNQIQTSNNHHMNQLGVTQLHQFDLSSQLSLTKSAKSGQTHPKILKKKKKKKSPLNFTWAFLCSISQQACNCIEGNIWRKHKSKKETYQNSGRFHLLPFFSWQGARFSLSQQVLNFEKNLNDLRNLKGAGNLTAYLAKSIVSVVFGSNDYINNYLLPNLYNSSSSYNPQDYADLLLNHYTRQILVIISLQSLFTK